MSEQALDDYAAERLARINNPRTFTFEGVTFHYKAAVPVAVLDKFFTRSGTMGEIEKLCDEVAAACLENPEAWAEIRRDDHEPLLLAINDIVWLTDQLLTFCTLLPTERPADSSSGPEEATATTSTDASSSAAETPSV